MKLIHVLTFLKKILTKKEYEPEIVDLILKNIN
jgi:hypothetical protein